MTAKRSGIRDYLWAHLFNVVLESKFRVRKLQVDRIIRALDIKPGNNVADIGAGTGLFSRAFAKAVQPDGTAYAVDTNPILTKQLATNAQDKGIRNLKTVLASNADFNLPEQVDMIFMCDVLHHVNDKTACLKNVRKYLKRDGSFAIIDFSDKWPPFHKSMKFTRDEYEAWMSQAGLRLVKTHDFLLDTMGSFFHVYTMEKS